jgi:hypothetical protein
MKICPVGADLFPADGRTDGQTDRQADGQKDSQADGQTGMTKLIFTLKNFANTPKKCKFNLH